MSERITPYKDGGNIEDRIDEIVAHGKDVHFEMMNNGSAWMSVGSSIFWLHAEKGKLVCRFSENEDEP